MPFSHMLHSPYTNTQEDSGHIIKASLHYFMTPCPCILNSVYGEEMHINASPSVVPSIILHSSRVTDMVFSLRQLQEKCREQQQPLLVAFIDLTKAFDLVSKDGLFKILPKIGCPPRLLNIIRFFHEEMKGTGVFDGSTSDLFDIQSRVKQGCVLALTLFGIFFGVMLKHAFGTATEGVYLWTRSEGKLFNPSRLRVKTKV